MNDDLTDLLCGLSSRYPNRNRRRAGSAAAGGGGFVQPGAEDRGAGGFQVPLDVAGQPLRLAPLLIRP
ncbi:hypothetical protein [Amycolatopsis sp. NPDC051716]|uniref:hypothetical protein n=1 Tax=Amycolatopsis sp. NPDC051716 TaxID=3155804 RepID=UPI003438EEFD